MSTETAAAGFAAGLALPSAADVRAAIDRSRQKKSAERLKERQAATAESKRAQEAFMASKLTPDFVKLLMARVQAAADSGEVELLVGQFPAAWCSDGGRKINAPENDWPGTLQGFARDFYDFWERELKPRGFRLRVEVISFPAGMPGDVGAFLGWGS